ncbi:response regulator transcription factor [Nonomuraea dietziae]|uniref:Regulatory protein n=2 Tax=Nonomuraea dietziae TaxID=65515 RepID=A0A7W5VEK5_9ACTN|nr:response regulator transcription factor [Nonomuraea dietziae]MBB3730030.1 hypothetical protein [Nonomuraea dietziae]
MQGHAMSVLGLTGAEEDVYRYFLRHPRTPARAIHGVFSFGEQRATRVISRLRDLRLLHGDDESTWATEPCVAVPRLVEEQLEAMHRTMRQLTDPWPVLRSLQRDRQDPVPQLSGTADGPGAALRRLEDLREVRAHIDELAFGVQEEVLVAEPYDALSPESMAHGRPIDVRCLRRGVRIRNLVRASALEDPASLSHLRGLHADGARIRVADELSELVLVYDRHTALLPIDLHDTARGALRIEESTLVGSVISLFERMWAAATDFAELTAPGAGQLALLSEAQQRVLTFMCTVSKDEVGAQRAGMSLRTYRRHIADLLRMLDAGNRAQAALMARERGWV